MPLGFHFEENMDVRTRWNLELLMLKYGDGSHGKIVTSTKKIIVGLSA